MQLSTGTEVAVVTLQVVVTQPLPEVGPEATQVPDGVLTTIVLHSVSW